MSARWRASPEETGQEGLSDNMDTAVTLDSFQVIVGLYLIYVAVKGKGTLYNFHDIPEEGKARVLTRLRLVYALCGVLALAEAGLCMWNGTSAFLEGRTMDIISSSITIVIVLILAGTFLWLRRLASGGKK